ncbi:MAG: HD domain-containing protein [Ardenticatenaceae bacterium]|nr:HD domain-containing protein [Ardenticatenaceae bacterium]
MSQHSRVFAPPDWSQEIYLRAWSFATRAHQHQTVGGPNKGERIPYINHIGAVTMEVIWAIAGENQFDGNLAIQCALLHDTVEDTPVTPADLTARFGPEVAAGVQALTKNKAIPTKEAQMKDSLNRITQQPSEVWLVKMADRITNLSEPPYDWDRSKRQNYQQEARLIYDALHGANKQLADRLLAKINAYSQYF